MTRDEFTRVMAYITAGSGKSLEPVSLEVYYDLLKDLAAETFLVGAKRVLLRHRFATFPTIAELREASTLTAAGQITALASAEAWALAWRAAGKTDPDVEGSFDRATKGLPPLVVRAMRVYGVNALCYGGEPLTVVRAQFMRVYEQLAAREREAAVLPAATRTAIEAHGRPALPAPAAALSLAACAPESAAEAAGRSAEFAKAVRATGRPPAEGQ